MPLNIKGTVATAIIDLLSTSPRQTANDILAAFGDEVSTAAVYKELNTLQSDGVVTKETKRFSLSTSWILSVADYASRIESVYLNPAQLQHLLPAPGETRRWHFRNLLTMDDFWNHCILTLLRKCEDPQLFVWSPRAWYALVHSNKEQKLFEGVRFLKKKSFVIFGGDGPLDRASVEYKTKPTYTLGFANSPFQKDRTKYMSVIDNYVLTSTIPATLAARIDSLFDNANRSLGHEEIAELMDIVRSRNRIAVELKNSPAAANTLKRKFRGCFGMES